MQDLSIAFVQASLHWESAEANLAMFEEYLWHIEGSVDVVVLPEMFTTGFTMNAVKVAEPMHLTAFRWMAQQAKQLQAAIVGSIVIKDAGAYYNRLVWMFPDSSYKYYDKRHLFRMAQEDQVYSAGKERLVVSWKGWRICPLICYDLRFPVWSRNRYSEGIWDYDCLLYVANWPKARVHAWETLLTARAMENLCYTIGVNRVGADGLGVAYSGKSAVYDPKGQVLQSATGAIGAFQCVLSFKELQDFRNKFPAYLDADEFKMLP